ERGNKGAALTTYVSLAGRFLVLMPNNPRAGGVSRRITGEDRDVVRQSLDELNPPEHMGCIVRTAGVGRETEELKWDLDYLLKVWEAIKGVVVSRPAPFLIYQEGNAIVRALRDYYSNEIGEILIDDPDVYQDAHDFMSRVMPQSLRKLKLYDSDDVPLFTRFQIESQIESAFAHSVSLPSGGSIVIDHTEALTAIDINSARSTKGEDIEQTAFNTNLEAAEEIARQLRIRDLGGLVVIDFIDMGPHRNQREVENRLREAVRQDRARIQIGKISRFGLLELSRQRLRPSLEESTQLVCPRCGGNGVVRGIESLALAVLRLVGEEARKDRTAKVIALVPVEVGNYILNEKREWVQTIQDNNDVSVVIVSDPELDTPNYSIRRVRDDETQQPENASVSYGLVQPKEDLGEKYENAKPAKVPEAPAVAEVLPATPAPVVAAPKAKPKAEAGPSLWSRIVAFFGSSEPEQENKKRTTSRRRSSSNRRSGGSGKRSGQGRQNRKTRSRSDGGNRDAGGSSGSSSGASSSGGNSSGGGRSGNQGGGSGSRNRRSRNRRGGRGRSQSNTDGGSAKSADSQKPNDAQKAGDAPKSNDAQKPSDAQQPNDSQRNADVTNRSDGPGSDSRPANAVPRDGNGGGQDQAKAGSQTEPRDARPAAAPSAPQPKPANEPARDADRKPADTPPKTASPDTPGTPPS
ncbi:MAG: Rne/Rng family ribonuclease, partial [Gammaproteobacteria bacterium]|nr:Rne/Rng family ribonuclease [Gammaproteobacteria bacterium]